MVKDNHLVAGGTVDELRAGIDRVRGAGMDHYVTKPFRSEELLRALAPGSGGERDGADT